MRQRAVLSKFRAISSTVRESVSSKQHSRFRHTRSGRTWEDAENKVKDAVKFTLGLEIEIERAHRVEWRKKPGRQLRSNAKQEPRTIVCKLRDWKQHEAVIREARRVKPDGLYIAEDLARAALIKRESQIAKMKEAKKAGKTAYFVLDRLVIRDKKTEENDD